MEGIRQRGESFRRSSLTILPEAALAVTLSLAIGLAARQFGLQESWQAAAAMAGPLLWAGGRALQWACHTWTVTPDGRLLVVRGVLFRTRLCVGLDTASQVRVRDSPAPCWLDVGDIVFETQDRYGQRHQIEGTWMGNHNRLCEVIHARGRVPHASHALDRQTPGRAGYRSEPGVVQVVCLPKQEHLEDYGRFMAFCHHLLRAGRGGKWPPAGIASEVRECWMEVLREARVITATQDHRGCQIGEGIDDLSDIRCRIGRRAFQRTVRRLAWSRLSRVRAA